MRLRFLLFLPIVVYGCRQNTTGQVQTGAYAARETMNSSGKTVEERFLPPSGYSRKPVAEKTFGKYLRTLPLKKHGSPALYFNGAEKPNPNVYNAVVAMDIGKRDLQQCADAVMRLRAEYLYSTGQKDKIHFNFTSGFRADYSKWVDGYGIELNGNDAVWVRRPHSDTYIYFLKYLDKVFSYAGTLSLSKELKAVRYEDMAIGDVLIQGGSPGHAVIVVDMAENKAGNKMYLLAQSYMPAQETQILVNPLNEDASSWYELNTAKQEIQTPQWTFSVNDLKRFED